MSLYKAIPRSNRSLNKTVSGLYVIYSEKLLVTGVPETAKAVQTLAIPLII